MKINILGTEYELRKTTNREDPVLNGKAGYCDEFSKVISLEQDFNENDQDAIQNFDRYKRKVARHEIVHAFLAESGLKDYCEDETITDWIAWQFPKMLDVFTEVNAI